MDFATLKKMLAQYQQPAVGGPIDLGNTADMARNIAVRKGLDDSFGDVKPAPGDDAIRPTDSPIDLVAGGLGAKLGGAMARDAGAIIGNEIGTVGYIPDAIKASRKGSEGKFSKLRQMLEPMLLEKKAIGQGAGQIADEATINNQLLNIAQRGVETEKMNPFDLNVASEKVGRSASALEKNLAAQKQKFNNFKTKL